MEPVTPISEARKRRSQRENDFLEALALIDAAAEQAVDIDMSLNEFIGLCVQHYRKYRDQPEAL